jgi:hypothetical protein
MTGRWREENWFRYGRAHCALDSLDSYAVTPDDPDRKVPTITASSLSATVQINHPIEYSSDTRSNRSLQLRPPRPDHPVAGLSHERIKRRPVLGGLINEYEQTA